MRLLTITLALIFIGLQYQLWFGGNGVIQAISVHKHIDKQLAVNEMIKGQNHQYRNKIKQLNSGLQALETMARHDLGLIRSGESYYQIVDLSNKQ